VDFFTVIINRESAEGKREREREREREGGGRGPGIPWTVPEAAPRMFQEYRGRNYPIITERGLDS